MIAASDHGYPRKSVFFTLHNTGFGNGLCTRDTLRGNYSCTIISRGPRIPSSHVVMISSMLAALRRLTHRRHAQLSVPFINVANAGNGAAAGRLVTSMLGRGCHARFARNGLGGRVNIPLAVLTVRPSYRVTIVRVNTGRPNRVHALISVTLPARKLVAGVNSTRLRKFNSLSNIVGAGHRLCSGLLHHNDAVFLGASSSVVYRTCHHSLTSLGVPLSYARGAVACDDHQGPRTHCRDRMATYAPFIRLS